MTACGRDTNEINSVRCFPDKSEAANREIKHKKPNKANSKTWIQFAQWLRQKKVKTVKDFKKESEWKCQYDEQRKLLHLKRNNEGYNVRKKLIIIQCQMSMNIAHTHNK